MRWIGRLGTAVILLTATMTPALAQPAKPAGGAAQKPATKPSVADPSNKDLANLRKEKAATAAAAGNWEDAYAEYRAAYALYAHWSIAVSQADAALKLGKYREAAETYRLVLSDPEAKKEQTTPAHAETVKKLAEAKAKIGVLNIAEAPAGTEIWLDGMQAGAAPTGKEVKELLVAPGPHDIEARKAGTVVAKLHLEAVAGKPEMIKLHEGDGMTAAATPPPAATTPPAATAPAAGPPPAATVAGAAAGAPPAGTGGPVAGAGTGSGDGGKPPVITEPPSGPNWPAVLVLGGVAVAGIAAGAGLWISSDGQGAEARKLYGALPSLPSGPCKTAACTAVHDALAGQAGLQTGAAIAWGVGAAAAAAAVATYVITSRGPAKTGARLIPVVAADTGGLLFQGSW